MEKSLDETMKYMTKLQRVIKDLMNYTEFEIYDGLSDYDIDRNNPGELFKMDELQNIMGKLADIESQIRYINAPVRVEGELHKKSNERYEVNGCELTCGCRIEYLRRDRRHETYSNNEWINLPYWCKGRVEHNGKEYYIVGADENVILEGLRIRIRKCEY
jgi:hypothetical protein